MALANSYETPPCYPVGVVQSNRLVYIFSVQCSNYQLIVVTILYLRLEKDEKEAILSANSLKKLFLLSTLYLLTFVALKGRWHLKSHRSTLTPTRAEATLVA